jgi:hypothetical protein
MNSIDILLKQIEIRLKILEEKKQNINLVDCYTCHWINDIYESINNEIYYLEESRKKLKML